MNRSPGDGPVRKIRIIGGLVGNGGQGPDCVGGEHRLGGQGLVGDLDSDSGTGQDTDLGTEESVRTGPWRL